jgi:hypothetical protein
MQSESLMKCAHDPCRCLAETEDEFCSTFCARAKAQGRETCECGHPECVAVREREQPNQPQAHLTAQHRHG